DDEVCLLVPPRTCHLRAIRLVAGEAGGRAGFSGAQLDDLRVAVDELCYTLMDATDQRLLLRVLVRGGRVIVRGCARPRPAPPPLRSSCWRTGARHHGRPVARRRGGPAVARRHKASEGPGGGAVPPRAAAADGATAADERAARFREYRRSRSRALRNELVEE